MINENGLVKACWLLMIATSCTAPNPRSCTDGLCTDSRFPFCDADGVFGGLPNECIAVECAPGEHIGCRGDIELTCNLTGNNYDSVECETSCIEDEGCEVPPPPPREPFILFVSDRDGNSEIYRMTADGDQPTNLTLSPDSDDTPIWDPTGERIAFRSSRGPAIELYVMDSDGNNVVNVSQGSADSPAWSPNGSALIFTSPRSGTNELYRVNVDGTSLLPITNLGNVGGGDWSPDGSKIAFTSGGRVHVMNADGTEATPITNGVDRFPKWRPDGSQIAFEHRVSFTNFDVFVMNVDGTNSTNITNITNTMDALEQGVRWSPDGTKLAFTGGIEPDNEVIVIQPNGSNSVNISNSPTSRDAEPCWSPDGASIAFTSDRTGNLEMMAIPSIGGNATNLTISDGADGGCAWRPL